MKIKNAIRKIFIKRVWRLKNRHNFTDISKVIQVQFLDLKKITVGTMSYGGLELHCFGAENEGLSIGNYVSIAPGVKFILGGNHRYGALSTYPFKVKCLGERQESFSKGPIIIEDDVWIGTDAIILSGIKIGKGSVIAAGAVISRDIPAYAIVAGNPARIIKYRFNERLCKKVGDFDFNSIDAKYIATNIDLFYSNLSEEILSKLEQKK